MTLKKILKNKKGYFLSVDAFIALIIILGVVAFIKPQIVQISQDTKVQGDLLNVLSSLKIGEINNSYVNQLIVEGNITNLNQSVLEQIGEFYAKSKPESQILAQNIIDNLNLNENVGIYFNGVTIASSGNTSFSNAKDIWTSRQIISGIQAGNSSKGFSSRAFLFSENKINYFYFGGYIGDGNITIKLKDGKITNTEIEAIFSGNFDIYINDIFAQSYTPTSNIPYKINLINYSTLFSSTENNISFKSNNSLYIAGGYMKVFYNNSISATTTNKQNLPGIDGVINIYDSFYVPGDLNSMNIFLHYNSSYNIFMTVGNKNIYLGNSNGTELKVNLTDTNFTGILNYTNISHKTIPFRLGLENVSYVLNFTLNADAFSVTDLSGSMADGCNIQTWGQWWCCWGSSDYCASQQTCNSCGAVFENKITMAKQANDIFIEAVLNNSGNRVGLVGYANNAPASDYHNLSENNISLHNQVNSWNANGGTCICCGINKATQSFLNESDSSKFQSMVVMSDGGANVRCSEQGTGDARQDAIQAACEAYNNYNITVHAVGFGSGADETTLQSIANCGNGNYYYGDVNQLVDIYKQIASEILNASYYEQTVVSNGIEAKLYSDSYISIDYNKIIPYGLLINAETNNFGNSISQGNFTVPNDTIPYEVKVISYSGSKWTDNVEVFNSSSGLWENIFNLSYYNMSYINLGDPYVINIPLNKINYGENSIKISTVLNLTN